MNQSAGKLIGVGTGPGDPELMTFKAARAIAEADAIAYPAANDGPSLARTIAATLGLDATYIEHASTAKARILPLSDAPDPAPYFSLALTRRTRDEWLA